MVNRSHKIALDPTPDQASYFQRACGVARFAYNWGIAEWKRERALGQKASSAMMLKRRFNAIRHEEFPWSADVTKCASAGAFRNLSAARKNLFDDIAKFRAGKLKVKRIRQPRFRKRGRKESFELWNDQFRVASQQVRVPHIGWVKMREPLRLSGRIMGATVSLRAGRWFIAIQVEMQDDSLSHCNPGSVVGIDLGVSTLMTLSRPLSDGRTAIINPRARRTYLLRQKRLQRRISRQELQRRKTGAKKSNRQKRRQLLLARLHYRVTNVRKDAIHKATSEITKHFETIKLEDLNVAGMVKNHALAGSIHDAAFGEIRRQFTYKARRIGLVDRFFPSSKTCSSCGHVMDRLPLSVREWACVACGAAHDRDRNAAINIERYAVGQAMSESTHGEMGALAKASATAKLLSVNRELNRAGTNVSAEWKAG